VREDERRSEVSLGVRRENSEVVDYKVQKKSVNAAVLDVATVSATYGYPRLTEAVFPPSFRRDSLDEDLEGGATGGFGVDGREFEDVAWKTGSTGVEDLDMVALLGVSRQVECVSKQRRRKWKLPGHWDECSSEWFREVMAIGGLRKSVVVVFPKLRHS
jgi:hypothetical protein